MTRFDPKLLRHAEAARQGQDARATSACPQCGSATSPAWAKCQRCGKALGIELKEPA